MLEQQAIEGLLSAIKDRNAEFQIITSALWNAHGGMTPVKALNEAIKEYNEIQRDIEENS